MPTSTRTWIRLGTTALDLAPIVKIVFGRSDARLFAISGEAMLMTAWTENRSEIAQLKEYASLRNGWVSVQTDVEETDDLDERCRLEAVDRIVGIETGSRPIAELFVQGVFAGQVAGDEEIGEIEARLGVSL